MRLLPSLIQNTFTLWPSSPAMAPGANPSRGPVLDNQDDVRAILEALDPTPTPGPAAGDHLNLLG